MRALFALILLTSSILLTSCTGTMKTNGVGDLSSQGFDYTYSWQVGQWGACSAVQCGTQGTQNRTVQCLRDQDSVVVADSFCPSPKPTLSQTCSAPACGAASCNLPWGGTIASGQSVVAYQAPTVQSPNTCVSQTRTCTNGTLSGSYTNASCTVQGGGGGSTFGMTIPTTHPKLWFNDARLQAARSWYQAHPFTPDSDDKLEVALKGLLANDSASCAAAVSWATGVSAGMRMDGVACDDCRWSGEAIILTYDWCYNLMSASQRSALQTSINNWTTHWSTESWGGPSMYQSNYFWGYTRNQILWGIASYETNQSVATTLMSNAFVDRLQNSFNIAATIGNSVGGIGLEGSQYGPYLQGYANSPWETAYLYGNDLFSSTPFWMETVYANIYMTMPAITTNSRNGSVGWHFVPFSDDERWNDGHSAESAFVANYMTTAASRWPTRNIAGYARQWLQTVGTQPEKYVQSTDNGGATRAFSNLPLDYFARGSSYLFGHSSWAPTGTSFAILMNTTTGTGHYHHDRGSWNIWRNGRWLSRETVEYSQSITGYGGSGTVGIDQPIATNSLLVNAEGPRVNDTPTPAKRMESKPGYTYASVDTSAGYSTQASHVEREYIFVRGLETMVIFDRIQSNASNATKTFLAHCEQPWAISGVTGTCTNGSQALKLTMLVPSNPSMNVIAEAVSNNSSAGQSRLEANTNPGSSQSYILTVLQAKDATAAALTPTVVDNGSSYTVNLNGTTSIVLNKGMSSSGGSITINGTTSNFRSDVQLMDVNEDGVNWH